MKQMLALLALVAVWDPATAPAQPPPESPPTEIILRPAAEPIPALKYRLVPERRRLVPGNAAIFYHRGIEIVIETQMRFALQKKEQADSAGARAVSVEEQIAQWVNAPLAEIPKDEARARLDAFQSALAEAELGATRLTCDWEFDQRQEGFHLLLPEIQQMRSLARLVILRVRLAILDSKTDEALHWIETGLVMGRHVSQGPTLIQTLVGVAIDSLLLRCLEEVIQVPGTPSLYWALADRPRPFIDMRYALEGELSMFEKELPELSELDRGPWSLDEARRFVDELQRKLFAIVANEPIPGSDHSMPAEMPALARRLGLAAMVAKIYPEARRALIARGRPEAEVDAMPVTQIAALYTIQEYRRMRDDGYKWINLPYWQSYNRADRSILPTVEQKLANPLLMLFSMQIPAIDMARQSPVRLDRQLDALQCIEAIRLYAAAHGGKLPETLEALTDSPVPIDPATGKPFAYRVEGNTALLSAPVIPGALNHPVNTIHYALKLAP